MVRVSFLKPCEVAEFVKDGDTIVTEGFVASCCPESLTKALEKRFLETDHPRNLTLMYSFCSQRNDKKSNSRSLEHGSKAWENGC